jgi:hypothetical protein
MQEAFEMEVSTLSPKRVYKFLKLKKFGSAVLMT